MKLTAPGKAATTNHMAKSIRLSPAEGKALSPLAMQIATEMNSGKSLEQIRALNPSLTDDHIAAFTKEMFELMGLAPAATNVDGCFHASPPSGRRMVPDQITGAKAWLVERTPKCVAW